MSHQSDEPQATIEYLLDENREFPPSAGFVAQANYSDPAIHERAAADPEAFWAEQAESLSWYRKWDQVLDWNPPFAQWFVGGKLNVAYNCLDRHVEAGKGDKVAYYWEGEPGDTRAITYSELLTEVCKTANALKELGVQKGDRVAVYMPMILEAPVALLACARIGAPHSMVFGGFSAEALRDRINDAQCTVVITADGGYRRGAAAALKPNVDKALEETPSVQKVLVARRTGGDVTMVEGRDVWWDDIVPRQSDECPPEEMDSEDMLYILYTSGTTAKPKGIVHTTAGYLLQTSWTHKAVFDIKDDDIYWCAADIGWVTGHSYIVYGPLANGTTSVMYEGTPTYPGPGSLVGHHRALQGVDPVLRANRHPRAHARGTPARGQARSVIVAPAWLGGRADQPGSLDLVPQAHRARAGASRRYLVANGNRRDHDFTAARDHHHQTRIGHLADAGDRCRHRERGRAIGATEW